MSLTSQFAHQSTDTLRIALPSDGAMYDPTKAFLDKCGLHIERVNSRRYTATIRGIPNCVILFQRAADITSKVEEGSADIGIVGLDRFSEQRRESSQAILVINDLQYSRCELTVAVPTSWIDVDCMNDLVDVSLEFRQRGKTLRIATKYPKLVRAFLAKHGISYFNLIQASGTLEIAPQMGYSDMITDITSTGSTLRENHLKPLVDGTILKSQACLIANPNLTKTSQLMIKTAKEVLDRIEASLNAREFFRLTVNIKAQSEEDIASKLQGKELLQGLFGPTISKVYPQDGSSVFSVTLMIQRPKLLDAVNDFRTIGGFSIAVNQPDYLFYAASESFEKLQSHFS